MKKKIATFLVSGLGLVTGQQYYNWSKCHSRTNELLCVKYVNNYDGDTITIEIPGQKAVFGHLMPVRVLGIDTPEIRGKSKCEHEAALKARELVTKLLSEAKRVDLFNVGRDKYFRILADVVVDEKYLKHSLLEANLAQEYDGGTKKTVDWCKSLLPPLTP